MPKKPIKKKDPQAKWYFTAKDAAEFFNIEYSAFMKRIASPDCPSEAKVRRSTYNIKVINDYFIEHFFGEVDTETTLQAEKTRNEKAKADLNEIKVKEANKELLPINLIISGLSFVLSGFKRRVTAWKKTLPPLLVGKSEVEMRLFFEKETREILIELSKGIHKLIPKIPKASKIQKNKKSNNGAISTNKNGN